MSVPEGPEVRLIADIIEQSVGKLIIGANYRTNKEWKWGRDGISGWDDLVKWEGEEIHDKTWLITGVQTQGKLIRINIYNAIKGDMCILNTLGMTGNWTYDSKSYHYRVWFWLNGKKKLSYVDQRNFGTIRVMSPEEADKKFQKIGWDLLRSSMITQPWAALQNKKTLKKKPIGTVLMDQKVASGIGNIYKAEVLYQVGVNPTTLVEDVSLSDWAKINTTAHRILSDSYKAGGSSVQTYKAGSKKGTYQNQLQIYKKKVCPLGHITDKVKQKNRTTWFCPTCQP